jgi:Zn-dependent protease with chaperone function
VVCFALLVCLALGIVAWYWGIPGLDQAALAIIPRSLDESVGAQAMASFDRQGLLPSRLDAEQQAAIRRAFDASLERAYPAGARPYYTLNFRAAGRMNLGPNAFALPGGRIVLTDELVELLADAPDVTVGALAHELGHLQHRHGMRMLVQAGLLAALADWMLGDFSSVRSAVPAILGQQAYARDFERQADQEAIAVLRASGQTPSRMALLFRRLAAWRQQHGEDTLTGLPIGVADHPADAERIRSFIEADGRR